MSEQLLITLQEKFPEITTRESSDFPAFNLPANDLLAAAKFIRDELEYNLLSDVTGIDWDDEEPRFSVVYNLTSTIHHRYLRLVVECADDEAPKVSSVVSIWPAADWHERETFDMFGIRFAGHPDLKRILMWDGYPYYPLRKDFPLAGIETELPDAEVGAETGADLIAAPMMGGPFVAKSGIHVSEDEPRGKDESWTEERPKPRKRKD